MLKSERSFIYTCCSQDMEAESKNVTGDICIVCFGTVIIPVIPASQCNCSVMICQHCFQQTLWGHIIYDKNLSSSFIENHYEEDRYKCMVCKAAYTNEGIAYTRYPRQLIIDIDNKNGDIVCPHCKTWTGSRTQFIDIHEAVCPCLTEYCSECGEVDRGEHNIICTGCNKPINKCVLRKHENKECTGNKCAKCGYLLQRHCVRICTECNTPIQLCKGQHIGEHYALEHKMINSEVSYGSAANDIYVSIEQATADAIQCSLCNYKYMLKQAKEHRRICLTLYDVGRRQALLQNILNDIISKAPKAISESLSYHMMQLMNITDRKTEHTPNQ